MDPIALAQKSAAVLIVSPAEEDHIRLGHILGRSNWGVHAVCTCLEGLAVLREKQAQVVICERDLPDGDWKNILDALTLMAHPPALIVTSRLADEYLWLDVLNLGGYDVVAKPLDEKEVLWAVRSAWRDWERQWEKSKRVHKAVA